MTKDSHDTPTQTAPQAPAPTPTQPADQGTSGLAIASLVLGILSFTGFGLITGVPAIITGVLALKKGQKERSMSIAGIIMGAITTFLSILLIGFLILLFTMGAMNGDQILDEAPSEYDFQMESSRT